MYSLTFLSLDVPFIKSMTPNVGNIKFKHRKKILGTKVFLFVLSLMQEIGIDMIVQ